MTDIAYRFELSGRLTLAHQQDLLDALKEQAPALQSLRIEPVQTMGMTSREIIVVIVASFAISAATPDVASLRTAIVATLAKAGIMASDIGPPTIAAGGGPPEADEAAGAVPASLALAFLVNADRVAPLVSGADLEAAADNTALREALAAMPHDRLVPVLGDVVTILVATTPSLRPMLEDARKRAEVRSADVSSSLADVSSLLSYLRQNAWLIPLVAVSLRLLGENRIKLGKADIKTGSVLKDLAQLIPRKK